jgi:hypothetical protein
VAVTVREVLGRTGDEHHPVARARDVDEHVERVLGFSA